MNILVVGTGAREHAICNSVKNAELYSIMSNNNPGYPDYQNFKFQVKKILMVSKNLLWIIKLIWQ